MDELFDIRNKVVLLTGAGRGLGFALAKGFCERGARVIVSGRNREDLVAAAKALAETGGEVRSFVFDALQSGAADALVKAASEIWGRLDVLVVSHGIGEGNIAEFIDHDQWSRVIDTDLSSAFFTAQAAAQVMLGQGDGSIVFISSTSGMRTFFGGAAYGAAKAGLDHLARHLALEWSGRGVRVNVISPGFMTSHMRGTEDFYNDPAYVQQVLERTPMHRKGTPEELVGAAIFLSSKAASFVTGQVLPVDGGWCLT